MTRTVTRDNTPPLKAWATPKEMAKIISPTASSKATIGKSKSVTGPCALYCLTTIKVAAGAVAEAMAPKTRQADKDKTSSPKTKCKTSNEVSTKIVAPRACKTPIMIVSLPDLAMRSSLNSAPMEKAIKPSATLERILKDWTSAKL